MADSESQGDVREERLANNEVIFRTVNEAIQQQALGFGVPDNCLFICECATVSCFDRISLSLQQYEGIRGEATTFVVSPKHVYDEIEQVTEKWPTYWVVRKDGAAGVASEFADPRDGDSA